MSHTMSERFGLRNLRGHENGHQYEASADVGSVFIAPIIVGGGKRWSQMACASGSSSLMSDASTEPGLCMCSIGYRVRERGVPA
jgi:hypothetical protein